MTWYLHLFTALIKTWLPSAEQHCRVVDASQGEGIDRQEFHHDAAGGKQRQTRGPWQLRTITFPAPPLHIINRPSGC